MRRVRTVVMGLTAWLILLWPPGAAASASHARSHVSAGAGAAVRCPHRNRASGTITVSDNFYNRSLNPFAPGIPVEHYPFLFDDLFRFDSRGRLFPMMATHIPTLRNGGIKNGGKTIVIQVKPGLRWSNGSEITSADLKFGWQIGMDPASGPYCLGSCDVIRAIDTPDRYTAVLHLTRPFPALLAPSILYVGGGMPPVFPHRWAPYWNGDAHTAAVDLTQDPSFSFIGPRFPTDGPYQAVRVQGNRTVLQPMKYYDDMNCGADVKTLIYTGYNFGATSSSAGQIAAALSGEADVGLNYFSSDIAILSRHSRAFHVHVEPTFSFEHLELNLDSTYNGIRNPLANEKVRQALALALDKRGVIERGLSIDQKAVNRIIAWTPWVVTPHLQQPYADREITGQWDPLANHGKGGYTAQTGSGQALADARRLLAQTPWKSGLTLDFYTTQSPNRLAGMSLIAQQWRKIGVTVNQHAVTGRQLFTTWEDGGLLAHGAFQVALITSAGGPDPDSLAYNMESRYIERNQETHNSTLNQNVAGIRDKVIDRAFDRATRSNDPTVRRQAFRLIQRTLNQRAYWIPLYYVPAISTSNNHVAGFQPMPYLFGETWNVYAWKARG
jgi:peptide/nickel transport system substrate-binding protein